MFDDIKPELVVDYDKRSGFLYIPLNSLLD